MGSFNARIMEISMVGNRLLLQTERLAGGWPRCGQYYLAFAPNHPEVFATPLYPCCDPHGEVRLTGNLPDAWHPGTTLMIRGPLGRGFILPPSARRVAVAALQGDLLCLLPLVFAALAQNAAVVCYTDQWVVSLPEDIEVLPVDALSDGQGWADYIACWTGLDGLSYLRRQLGLPPGSLPAVPVEVMIETALVCGGMADCGVCAVPGKKSWKLACKDGPVFRIGDIEVQ